MTKKRIRIGLVSAAAVCAAAAAAPGCELVADFDRGKIPQDAAAGGDVIVDAPADVLPDTPKDAPVDSPPDVAQDVTPDAGDAADAPADVPGDAPFDAPADVIDGGGGDVLDAPPDAAEAAADGAEAGSATFTVTPSTFDFGTVAQAATTSDVTFTIKNIGSASGTPAISVTGADGGGGGYAKGSTDTCTGQTIAVSGTCSVSVRFTPSGAGVSAGSLGASPGTPATLTATGAASGTLALAPTSRNFGTLDGGVTGADFAFTVTNGDAINAVSLLPSRLDGQNASQFAVSADGGTGQCAAGTTLAPNDAGGSSCTLFVHFAPTSAGFKYGSVSIGATATDGGAGPGTASASVTGTGN